MWSIDATYTKNEYTSHSKLEMYEIVYERNSRLKKYCGSIRPTTSWLDNVAFFE